MSVSGISSYNYLTSIYGIDQIDTSQIASNINSGTSSIQSGKDQASFSPMGQMMSQLMQLQSSDPTQFKQVAQKISDDLATQAASSTDSTQSQMLSDMSTKFATAAQTGDMSSLKPSGHSRSSGKSFGIGGGQGGQDTMSEVANTISNDLNGISNASTSVSSNAGISLGSNAGLPGGPGEMGMLMDQLRKLQSSDPTKFKEVTEKISQDLASEAGNTTNSAQSQMLSDMSSKFAEASSSGDMSSLRPTPPPPPPSMSGQDSDSSGQGDAQMSSSASQQQAQSMYEQIQNIMANDLSSYIGSTGVSV